MIRDAPTSILADGRLSATPKVSGYTLAADGAPVLIGATGVVASTEPGPIDTAASGDGRFLYLETGVAGTLDTYFDPG